MQTMRERIAVRLFERERGAAEDWDKWHKSVQSHFLAIADAALEAMREPTQGMVAAAHDLDEDDIVSPIHESKALLCRDGPALIWQVMIDHARKEEG